MDRPDIVLFDFDGVIVDSRTAFARSVNAALAAVGEPTLPEAELHPFLGPPLHETLEAMLGEGPVVQRCVDLYRERYRRVGAEETTVMDGIPELLARLGRAYPMVVATSKPKVLAEPLLETFGLRRHFRAVFGPALEAVHESKGETIHRAMADQPDGTRALMIGDRRHDVEGARANGIPTIGVLWGIGSASELTTAGAVQLVESPSDLAELLDV